MIVQHAPAPATIASDDRFLTRLTGDFAARSIELAKASHLDGAARLERMGQHTIAFTVPSRNRSSEYAVIADHAGSVWCPCPAGKHNKACSHAGSVYHALRQLAEACRNYGPPEPEPAPAPKPRRSLPPVRTLDPGNVHEWDEYRAAFDRDLAAGNLVMLSER